MSELSGAELAAYQSRFAAPRTTTADLSPTVQPTLRATTSAPLTAVGGTLTADETAYLRAELGPTVDLTDAQTRYARLGEARLVVLEVLRERLAALTAGPAQYAISGVYSQDTSANIAALREQLTRVAGGDGLGGVPTVTRTRLRPRRGR